jgi:UDP-N-acetylglucosamine 3-dehydrogenase
MAKIGVAVIGVGNMGKNHARVYSRMHDAELVAVCDINMESAKKVAKAYDAKWYSDYRIMLDKEEEIDAVSIAVPTTKHEEVALGSIDYGKHVLIEKPIAESIEIAQRIVEKAKSAGVKLMVGHIERFNPAVTKVEQFIHEDRLGQIVSISSKRVGPYANIMFDVGVILDLAIHDIDVMRFITKNEVCEVYAKIGSGMCSHEDYASILLTLHNGVAGLIETNWLTPTKIRRLDVTGMNGYVTLDYIKQEIDLYGKALSKNLADYEELVMTYGTPQIARIRAEKEEPLKLELEHFLQSIVNDSIPRADGQSGIENLKVALAALQSAQKRRPIIIARED